MNPQNLTHEEVKMLHALLGKMLEQSEPEVDPIDKMIDDIINEFDFDKVQIAMEYLRWEWADANVPNVIRLKSTARRLLKDAARYRLGVYEHEHWEQGIQSSTGGFEATAYCDKDKSKIIALDLKFILTGWNSELEDFEN
jgi:hypothetical protein